MRMFSLQVIMFTVHEHGTNTIFKKNVVEAQNENRDFYNVDAKVN